MKKSALTLLALLLGLAQAHPVDEVVQGAYLTLAPGKVQLELDLTPGTQVAATVLSAIDTDTDGKITGTEARSYAKLVLRQSTLKLNGVVVSWTLDTVEMPPYSDLKTGNAVLKIYALAKRADAAGAQSLSYENRYQPVKSQWIANIFLLPAAGWQYGVTGQQHSNDGRQLTVKYQVTRS
ncbi:hypothetical protein [Deinococcus alpinitundrae]|uniref:hypothetical protein n=1 Tax=Deinococcus alpinitundrae TaxID=468913 RepID=UPI001379C29D|nr:hypothetical protein [Deinococcus alpinitundrae]